MTTLRDVSKDETRKRYAAIYDLVITKRKPVKKIALKYGLTVSAIYMAITRYRKQIG